MGLSDNDSGSPFCMSIVGLPMKRVSLGILIIRDSATLFSYAAVHPSTQLSPVGLCSPKDRKSHERGTMANNEKRV